MDVDQKNPVVSEKAAENSVVENHGKCGAWGDELVSYYLLYVALIAHGAYLRVWTDTNPALETGTVYVLSRATTITGLNKDVIRCYFCIQAEPALHY